MQEELSKEELRNQKKREYMAKRYKERREYVIKKLGGKCVECGSTLQLEVDHKDSEDKEFNPFGRFWSYPMRFLDLELEKCQLLCRKHHIEKSRAQHDYANPAQHGTTYMYMEHNCRCDLCTAVMRKSWAKSKRNYRRRKRYDELISKQIGPYIHPIKKNQWQDVLDQAYEIFSEMLEEDDEYDTEEE